MATRQKKHGLGYTYNVPILVGSGNKEYLAVYRRIRPSLARRIGSDHDRGDAEEVETVPEGRQSDIVSRRRLQKEHHGRAEKDQED
jgi:hypothetical protein